MPIYDFSDYETEDLEQIMVHLNALSDLLGEDVVEDEMIHEIHHEIERKKNWC